MATMARKSEHQTYVAANTAALKNAVNLRQSGRT